MNAIQAAFFSRLTDCLSNFQQIKQKQLKTLENCVSSIEKGAQLETNSDKRDFFRKVDLCPFSRLSTTVNKKIVAAQQVETKLFAFAQKNEHQLSERHVRQFVNHLLDELKRISSYLETVLSKQICAQKRSLEAKFQVRVEQRAAAIRESKYEEQATQIKMNVTIWLDLLDENGERQKIKREDIDFVEFFDYAQEYAKQYHACYFKTPYRLVENLFRERDYFSSIHGIIDKNEAIIEVCNGIEVYQYAGISLRR